MVDKLVGYWKLEKDENLEAYMVAKKVGMILRKVAKSITCYEEISREGDEWSLSITSTFKSTSLTFKLGEPFTEKTLEGRNVQTTFSIEGNKLITIHEPLEKGDVPARFEREIMDDGRMLLTCTALPENVTAKRYFQPCQK